MRTFLARGVPVVVLSLLAAAAGLAADHAEAPGTGADAAADIADLYAWYDGAKLITVITFDGKKDPSFTTATYDANVRYTVNIDNDTDNVADVEVDVQFEQDASMNWIMRIENLPGTSGTVTAPVGTSTDVGGYFVYAGLRDDPFFFDSEGFLMTLATGTLMFDNTRDSFAGFNATAIVLEMSLSGASNGNVMNIWATTARRM